MKTLSLATLLYLLVAVFPLHIGDVCRDVEDDLSCHLPDVPAPRQEILQNPHPGGTFSVPITLGEENCVLRIHRDQYSPNANTAAPCDSNPNLSSLRHQLSGLQTKSQTKHMLCLKTVCPILMMNWKCPSANIIPCQVGQVNLVCAFQH